MNIFILTEPAFEESTWCIKIFEGLEKQIIKRKLKYTAVKEVPTPRDKQDASFLIMIATDINWIKAALPRCHKNHLHPIILSPHIGEDISGVYSSVTSDIRHSVHFLLKHLRKLGRTSPALYGVNEASLADISRRESFLELSDADAVRDVYYNKGSLENCFKDFYANKENYDCVICVNDFTALSLMRRLDEINYPTDKLLPVSYGNTRIVSTRFSRLLSISLQYEEYGKAAIYICEGMAKNPALLYMNVAVKWSIGQNDEQPVNDCLTPCHTGGKTDEMKADELFYSDNEMCEMIIVENMLAACDATDLTLLKVVLKGGSYEEAAAECFVSANTVKYRIKKLMDICGFKSKKDFISFVKKYY